ncbi:hypothetical protein ACA910_007924 [Epithemia clementina (nom. ined.)]
MIESPLSARTVATTRVSPSIDASAEDRQRRMNKYRSAPSNHKHNFHAHGSSSPRHQHSNVMAEMISSQKSYARSHRVEFNAPSATAAANGNGIMQQTVPLRHSDIADYASASASNNTRLAGTLPHASSSRTIVEQGREFIHHHSSNQSENAPLSPYRPSVSAVDRGRNIMSPRRAGDVVAQLYASARSLRYDNTGIRSPPLTRDETNEFSSPRQKPRPVVTFDDSNLLPPGQTRDYDASRGSPRQHMRPNGPDNNNFLPPHRRNGESCTFSAQSFRPVAVAGAVVRSSFDHRPSQSQPHVLRPFQSPPIHGDRLVVQGSSVSQRQNLSAMSNQRAESSFYNQDSSGPYQRRGSSSGAVHQRPPRVPESNAGSNANLVDRLSAQETAQLEEKMLKMAMERSLAEAQIINSVAEHQPRQVNHSAITHPPTSSCFPAKQQPQAPYESQNQVAPNQPPRRQPPPPPSGPPHSISEGRFQEYIGVDDSHYTDPETAMRLAELEQEREMLELAIEQSLHESFNSVDPSFLIAAGTGTGERSYHSSMGSEDLTSSPTRSPVRIVRRNSGVGTTPSLFPSSNNEVEIRNGEDGFIFDEVMLSPGSRTASTDRLQQARNHPYSSGSPSQRDRSVAPSVVQVSCPPRVHPLERANAKNATGH